MTLTVRRRLGQLFCRVSCPRVTFLLPHYKILVYNVGTRRYTNFLIHLLFMHVQNYSVPFSCLYVLFWFPANLVWPGVRGVNTHLVRGKTPETAENVTIIISGRGHPFLWKQA